MIVPGPAAPAFVGRAAALTEITDTITRAVTGPATGAQVLVEGEAGIGKTRLVREVLAAPALVDRVVLLATCPPLGEPFPLGPIVDALRRVRGVGGGPAASTPLFLSPLGGALRPLLPEWAGDLPPAPDPLDDPAEVRHRLFRALTELVERLGVALIVVEDVHWADTASLDWLLAAVTSGGLTVPVVLTYRPHDVPAGSALLRLTSRPVAGRGVVRIELAPLDVAQIRSMVGSMLATDDVSEEFASYLRARTDGIPLAVEETVRLLRDRRDIIRRHGTWARRALDELRVPPTVRDSVLERVARLDPAAARVLAAAAVLVEPADEVLLGAVAGFAEADLRAGLADALASGLLREAAPGSFAFRHVLDAEAVGGALPVSERRRLHQRAGERLSRAEPAPAVRLARHFREAGDVERWCRYAEISADLALSAGDDHTATDTLLALLGSAGHPVDRRVRLTRKLVESAVFGSAMLGEQSDRTVATLRGVLTADLAPTDRGELRLMLGRLLWHADDRNSAYVEFEAAVPDLGDRPELAAQAMLLLATPLATDWPADRHRAWVDRAVELLPAIDPARRANAEFNLATALLLLGDEAGWDYPPPVPGPGDSADELRFSARVLLNMGLLALLWGRCRDAGTWLDQVSAVLATTSYGRLHETVRGARAVHDWYTGSWSGLHAVATELAGSDSDGTLDQLQAGQLVGLLDLARGARAPAERGLRAAVAAYTDRALVDPDLAMSCAGLGRLHLVEHAAEDALAATGAFMATVERKGLWLWATDVAPVHVAALLATGGRDAAAEVVDRFAAWARGRDAPGPAAALLSCRALLAAEDQPSFAAGEFAAAAAAWAALPRPYEELLALELRARCLVLAGDRTGAVALLMTTQDRLRTLGAGWDADRVARRLRGLGVEVTRTWRRGPRGYGDQLSPRELEVAGLVARGMTNKQIAEVLFLSVRTVGHHLAAAMRKLGVSSRTALAVSVAGPPPETPANK